MRRFARHACIDWSGAATARQPGIAVAVAGPDGHVTQVERPGGWSRPAVLEWLAAQARDGSDMLIGLDLSPALPFIDCGAYFPGWPLSPPDARALWALVDTMCAADPHLAASSLLSHDEARRHFRQRWALGDLFVAGRGRMRRCEFGQAAMGLNPTSCFNLVGPAQVGKSSLTGMRVFHRLGGTLPFWPFDPVPETGPCLVEIYTTIAARAAGAPRGRSKFRSHADVAGALAALGASAQLGETVDEHAADALVTAAWLRAVAADGRLWSPASLDEDIACTEGWTFGVI